MAIGCEIGRNRALQDAASDGEGEVCCTDCDYASSRPEIVRIATWANAAPVLQAYLTLYQSTVQGASAQNIRLSVMPSLQELQQDVRHDLKTLSGLYSGFLVPPMIMGDLLEQEGLAILSVNEEDSTWRNLLPYYRNQVATLAGEIRGVPLVAGNQLLVLYRKDYFESMGLSTPVTWGDYVRIAASLHDRPLGLNGSPIFGSCMGRLTEAACRQQMDEGGDGGACQSSSMSYLGMMLAPMTQVDGSASGWLFDGDATQRMNPLLNPPLERALIFMEQQLKFGAPNELDSDASLNLELFRQGRCAMTVTVDHPSDLLNQPNVGFAPIPGSHNFLGRQADTMVDCTPELCPFGKPIETWGTVNQAPFGATDMVVGSVSTFASSESSAGVQAFFDFVMQNQMEVESREQPLTYAGLAKTGIEGYQDVMTQLTESNNTATPVRIPNAFGLWSELDNQVYDYLVAGNFSEENRQRVQQNVARSWGRMIQQHDEVPLAVPTSLFYEKSLGTFSPTPSSDLYIGTTARAIGWGMGGFSCFCSLLFAVWVWRHQNEQMIKASQAKFLYMICGGTFLMTACIFTFGIEDDIASQQAVNRSCMASMWLYCMGYVITFTALFSKIWLVNRIFREARNMQRIKLESVDILIPLMILLGINFILLITWNSTDPLKWVRDPVDEPTTTLNLEQVSTYGYCDSENYRIYLGLMLGVNYAFSVVALVQAYECRKVSTDYDESLWISGALACIVQVWTIGLPLLKLLDDNPRAIFLVKVGVVLITTLSTLFLIFVPKIQYLRQSLREPQRSDDKKGGKGIDTLRASYVEGRESITSYDASDEDHHYNYHPKALTRMSVQDPSSSEANDGRHKPSRTPAGLEGIRIIQTPGLNGEEVQKLSRSLRHAEGRHKTLNDRLERLQDKLEQHIVSRHPHGQGDNNFILAARSEQTRITGHAGEIESEGHQ